MRCPCTAPAGRHSQPAALPAAAHRCHSLLLGVHAEHGLFRLLAEQSILPRVLRLALRQVHAPVDLRRGSGGGGQCGA